MNNTDITAFGPFCGECISISKKSHLIICETCGKVTNMVLIGLDEQKDIYYVHDCKDCFENNSKSVKKTINNSNMLLIHS